MKRICISMPEKYHKRLKTASRQTGLTVSEIIRQAVDARLKTEPTRTKPTRDP
jgi:predicted DNA-binding protein